MSGNGSDDGGFGEEHTIHVEIEDVVEESIDDVWRPEWLFSVTEFLQSLTDDERLQLFSDFCCRCGKPKINGGQQCDCRS